MNETGRYLDEFARATSALVTATVKVRNDDDTYMVETVASRAILRAAKNNPVDEFAIGSRVRLDMTSATRAVVGAMPVITNRAPREQRGLSGSTPADARETSSPGATITGVDPDPLIVIAGGEPVTQVIMGAGFESAATYSAQDDGPDPDLTFPVAAVITDQKVTMTVAADAGSPRGDFSAAIGTAVAPLALRVIDPPAPVPSLWLLGGVPPDSAAALVRLNPATFATWSSIALPDTNAGDLGLSRGAVCVKTEGHVVVVDRVTGDRISEAEALDTDFRDSVAIHGNHLFYATGGSPNLVLVDVDLATGVATTHDYDPHGTIFSTRSVAHDGTHIWIRTDDELVKINAATFAEEDRAPFAGSTELAAVAGAVFIMQTGAGQTLSKIDPATLTATSSIVILPVAGAYSVPTHMRADGLFIYGTCGSPSRAFRVHSATMAAVIVDPAPRRLSGFAVVEGLMYAGDDEGGVNVIDFDTATVTARHQTGAEFIDRVAYG